MGMAWLHNEPTSPSSDGCVIRESALALSPGFEHLGAGQVRGQRPRVRSWKLWEVAKRGRLESSAHAINLRPLPRNVLEILLPNC
ncbi:hypothetical protein Cadr_000028780 [Camelus dromedarius]|uniref:Uncharacterized protein n=1 Tax=Camelus dromedarius TaxID=9838 RepID=A0A5N4C958_CAMDR|nr:hypothetical protein Cadr_000028780 [Camelus dromedarius]